MRKLLATVLVIIGIALLAIGNAHHVKVANQRKEGILPCPPACSKVMDKQMIRTGMFRSKE